MLRAEKEIDEEMENVELCEEVWTHYLRQRVDSQSGIIVDYDYIRVLVRSLEMVESTGPEDGRKAYAEALFMETLMHTDNETVERLRSYLDDPVREKLDIVFGRNARDAFEALKKRKPSMSNAFDRAEAVTMAVIALSLGASESSIALRLRPNEDVYVIEDDTDIFVKYARDYVSIKAALNVTAVLASSILSASQQVTVASFERAWQEAERRYMKLFHSLDLIEDIEKLAASFVSKMPEDQRVIYHQELVEKQGKLEAQQQHRLPRRDRNDHGVTFIRYPPRPPQRE